MMYLLLLESQVCVATDEAIQGWNPTSCYGHSSSLFFSVVEGYMLNSFPDLILGILE